MQQGYCYTCLAMGGGCFGRVTKPNQVLRVVHLLACPSLFFGEFLVFASREFVFGGHFPFFPGILGVRQGETDRTQKILRVVHLLL